METTNLSSAVTNITSAQLRQYLQSHQTSEYALIDVRQTEEYLRAHIPGSRLIPLREIESDSEELRKLVDRDLIFYCRGGVRSERACAWVAKNMPGASVRNLLGGFMGWDGPALTDFPRAASFDLEGPIDVLLRQAMVLEKGTHRLYELISTEHPSGILGETIAALIGAELAHGEAVYRLLTSVAGDAGEGFEATFAKLPSAIIENGIPSSIALARAREMGQQGELALLEMALQIEFGAHDLYENLALSVSDQQARRALEELAQEERAHANLVLRAIGDLAQSQAN